MAKKSSMEGILFQFNNPFGKEMEEVFQKTINYVNSIDYTGTHESKWTKHRYTLTHSYAKNTLFPELIKIIFKHTNIEIIKVVDVRCFSGMFAVEMGIKDWESVVTIMEQQSGQASDKPTITSGVNEILKIRDNLNTRTGKIEKPVKAFAKLYMDVDCAFLMNDNVNEKLVDNFTAGELTAIYLHEVGHILTMIEESRNMYQSFERVNNHLVNIRMRNIGSSPKEIMESYNKDLRPALSKAVSEKKIDSKVLKAGDELINAAKYLENRTNVNVVGNILIQVGALLLNLYYLIIMIYLRFVVLELVGPLIKTLLWFTLDKPGRYVKSTDQSLSDSVFYHSERMADHYVSKYGYGAELATGLSKLGSLSRTFSVPFTNHQTPWLVTKMFAVVSEILRVDQRTLSTDIHNPKTYEEDIARMERILTSTYAAFKQNMPNDVVHDYLLDIDTIKETIKKSKKNIFAKGSDLLWTYVLDFPMVTKRLAQNDDMEEMERWLTKTDKLIDNELYAVSAKFKHLIK